MTTVRRLLAGRGPWPVGLLRVGLLLLIVGELFVTATIQHPGLLHPETVGTDASNYYAAGQRLNDGHPLYGPLEPGDRPVPGYPGTYPAPLLSPPLDAVIWRPLAVLPGDLSMVLWWLAGLVLLSGMAIGFALVARPPQLLLLGGILALGVPLTLILSAPYRYPGANSPVSIAALSGNINNFIAGLFVLTWWASSRGRPRLAGAAAALATALKLGPVVLLWWFVTRRDWRAVRYFAIALVGFGLVGLVFAGLDSNLAYLKVATGAAIKPTTWSVASLAHRLLHIRAGRLQLVALVTVITGLVAMVALRNRPRAGFFVAILVSIFSSPVVLQGNFALLLAAAAPWVFPRPVSVGASTPPPDARIGDPGGRTSGAGTGEP